MSGRDVVASPVLVGRDELLALAGRRLEQAAAGHGHLLFVAGEAGIGKSRLLGSVSRSAERLGFSVLRATAFPGDQQDSGGVLLDLAGDLRRAGDDAARSAGAVLAERLREPQRREGDRHRRRRLLVQDLSDALTDLDDVPRLIVLEDLHWADQLSLEVVAHLATRLPGRACLMLGAYRSDELYPRTAMRDWRSRLLSGRLAEEVRLPRMTAAQTATLASAVLGRPAPAQVVAAIHDRSDGIPLHIEELLAAATDEATGVVREPDLRHVPDTLADAVLARAAALPDDVRAMASAAAVIGRSFDVDLLADVTAADAETVDRCLRELRSVYLVRTGAGPAGFDFRHALIRDALYDDVPLPRRRLLHERVAEAAVRRGYPDAFVSAHYDQAGMSEPAYRHARAAARAAATISAHREALELDRRALRNAPADVAPAELADLLAALAGEAAAVDDNDSACEAFERAHDLRRADGDLVGAAALVAPLVSVTHLLGESLPLRVRRLQSALDSIEGLPDAEPVRAGLLSGLAAAYMLDRRLEESIRYGELSRALVQGSSHGSGGERAADLNTAATLGSVLLFTGQLDAGHALLEESITRAVQGHEEAEAGRGYRMLGTSASVLVEYERAAGWLRRGIDYADAVELWNHRSYMSAHLAHVHWARGEWAEAEQTAEHALADGRGGITTRITALYVLGYVQLGRGELDAADDLLAQALQLGESMAELQRISPPLWGLAQSAALRGDHARAVELCERGYALSREVADAAYLFPFLVTGVRAHLSSDGSGGLARDWFGQVRDALVARSIPGTLPAVDHARGLLELDSGDLTAADASLTDAAAAWGALGRFWEGSWAVLDQATAAVLGRRPAQAVALAEQVRASAGPVAARPLLDAAGAVLEQARPKAATTRWHPLSEREFEVAALVAEGLTNRQIAERLFLSPRTVSAHVEHILSKLGAARRAEIAAWASRRPAEG
ncbi:helix-turn-helix transcriptional regulator [Angustibacter luteus]|uniref:LuxR C-terminal-related transcriptional regulator n=1 Tax=Angustibacter luteus TaxID=658456 RepID=A0ABW1JI42_9ACTN